MASQSAQVFDMRPSTGMSEGQSNEHLRKYSDGAYAHNRSRNFDPTRVRLNFEVTRGGKIVPVNQNLSIVKRIEENLKERGIKNPNEGLAEDDPNRRKIHADIIFQGSRTRMRELAFGDQELDEGDVDRKPDNSHIARQPEIEQWAIDMYNFTAKKFGEKNIAAFVVHLDETNPHIHCTLLTTGLCKGKEQISWAKVFGVNKYEGGRILKELHDELAEVNKKWGLERGRSVHETGARHRTTEQYWRELSQQCTDLENENTELEEKRDSLELSVRQLETKKKGLTTMLNNLEQQRQDLLQQRQQLIDEIEQLKTDNGKEAEKLQKKLDQLNEQLNKTEDSIRDKEQKLQDTNSKLEKALQMYDDVGDKVNTVSLFTAQNVQQVAWQHLSKAMHDAHDKTEEYKKNLPVQEQRAIDNLMNDVLPDELELFEDIADHAEEIVAVATGLFLGYIDQATTFAKTSGGGGGSPGKGWGRKKDEDDFAFMGRCFNAARTMCRPASAKKIKR